MVILGPADQRGSMTHLESIQSGQLSLRFRMGDRPDIGLLTCGVGGIAVLRPPGPPAAAATIRASVAIISHHRGEDGVDKAAMDAVGDYVLTLGADGTLVMVALK